MILNHTPFYNIMSQMCKTRHRTGDFAFYQQALMKLRQKIIKIGNFIIISQNNNKNANTQLRP